MGLSPFVQGKKNSFNVLLLKRGSRETGCNRNVALLAVAARRDRSTLRARGGLLRGSGQLTVWPMVESPHVSQEEVVIPRKAKMAKDYWREGKDWDVFIRDKNSWRYCGLSMTGSIRLTKAKWSASDQQPNRS